MRATNVWRNLAVVFVVVAFLVSISMAVAVGLIPGQLLAEVMSSFLGAAVAVWGAVWATDYREKKQQRQVASILGDLVFKLRLGAESLGVLHGGQFGPVCRDSGIEAAHAEISARFEQLVLFRPYRELGDIDLVSAITDLDYCCQRIISSLNSVPPRAKELVIDDDPTTYRFSYVEVGNFSDWLQRECSTALKVLKYP